MENRAKLLHLSTGPHARSGLTTQRVMLDVILALMPATVLGVAHFGFHALMVVLTSVLTAVVCEAAFCWACKKPSTVSDLSCIVTGLLLALCLPAGVPLYIPFLGSMFAIIFVKCLFGGLGKNIMNPALAGRCFLAVSFTSILSTYHVDGITSATPLAEIIAGGRVDLWSLFMGFENGVIGCSIFGLVIGGIYLFLVGGIFWEIPVSMIGGYSLIVLLFSKQPVTLQYLLVQLSAGGVVMGALFMATDPATSPVTSGGHLLYGLLVGALSGLFRVRGSTPDSVSYAIIMCNMVVPFINILVVKKPYGNRVQKPKGSRGIPKPALILCCITLVSGLILSSLYTLTKDKIEELRLAANAASYQKVCEEAEKFEEHPEMKAAIEDLNGEVWGTTFGHAFINEAVTGLDADGNPIGYVISATSTDGMEGEITLSIGLDPNGVVRGIAFTMLNETPGLGSLCGEEKFTSQFKDVDTDAFSLDDSATHIDGVSGATISSSAVINAINAALDFYNATVK